MDFNSDGLRDVISGSYPGELYAFYGTEDGGFRPAERIKDKDGKDIRIDRAATAFAVDWEGDGDLDLVVGDIQGRVHLVPNESGGKELAFGKSVQLQVGETPIAVPGRNSGPVVADWDGDGRHDLLVGCGDGSVRFFRNTAKEGAPVLADPVVLVDQNTVGHRAKIAVIDYRGDGTLDLLVGDVTWERFAKELTPEQEKKRDELRDERIKVSQEYRERWEPVSRKVREQLGLDPDEPGAIPADKREEYTRLYRAALEADPELRRLQARMTELWQELRQYEGTTETHGYVYVFEREE